MYRVLGSQNSRIIIEDMEHEIIYVMDKSTQLRIIEGYKETYTNADNIPPRIMMELVACMIESMKTMDIKEEDKEMVTNLYDKVEFAKKLFSGGMM